MRTKKQLLIKGSRIVVVITLACGFWGVMPVQEARAGLITVTNTNESGVGSLRQAVIDATAGAINCELRSIIPP